MSRRSTITGPHLPLHDASRPPASPTVIPKRRSTLQPVSLTPRPLHAFTALSPTSQPHVHRRHSNNGGRPLLSTPRRAQSQTRQTIFISSPSSTPSTTPTAALARRASNAAVGVTRIASTPLLRGILKHPTARRPLRDRHVHFDEASIRETDGMGKSAILRDGDIAFCLDDADLRAMAESPSNAWGGDSEWFNKQFGLSSPHRKETETAETETEKAETEMETEKAETETDHFDGRERRASSSQFLTNLSVNERRLLHALVNVNRRKMSDKETTEECAPTQMEMKGNEETDRLGSARPARLSMDSITSSSGGVAFAIDLKEEWGANRCDAFLNPHEGRLCRSSSPMHRTKRCDPKGRECGDGDGDRSASACGGPHFVSPFVDDENEESETMYRRVVPQPTPLGHPINPHRASIS